MKRPGVELHAVGPALDLPEVAMGVDHVVAEEIEDDGPDSRAFGEVVEVGLEDVLDIGQVGGDDTPDVARVAEDEGVWRGVGEGVSYPVVESVPVLKKLGRWPSMQ